MKNKSLYIISILLPGLFFVLFPVCAREFAAAAQTLNKDLYDLKETERDFAATAVKEGFRDSFIKFFADDGIGFGPQPGRTKETLQKRPPSTAPRITSFNWQPMFGDISLDGDLGYTTGPLVFTDLPNNPKPQPPRNGMYFSVWQKQTDGSWRVAVDMGVDTPQAIAPIDVGFTAAAASGIKKNKTAGFSADDYNRLDEKFSNDIGKSGQGKAYSLWVNDQFRIHRSGIMPILTKADLNKFFENKSEKLSFKQLGGKISTSKDMAFTYGSFQTIQSKEDKPEGYYVHVWRRDKSGKWKLVVDVASELPK